MNKTWLKVAILMALSSLTLSAALGETIQIQGSYVEERGGTLNVGFEVTLTSNACQIYATNIDDSNIWENVTYDGTNTYLLTPRIGHPEKLAHASKDSSLCGLVCPGRQYYMMNHSTVKTYFPWIVFCLRPQDIIPDKTIIPAVEWRDNIAAFGERWTNITALPGGRFLKGFYIVKDTSLNESLDLNNLNKLNPGYEYPISPEDLADQQMQINLSEGTPDGWIGREYICSDWYETNGFAIPVKAEMVYSNYSNITHESRLVYRDTMDVQHITISKAPATILPPPLTGLTYVRDYRYTRRDDQRMFRYAPYNGIGFWKSTNDPGLLAQSDYFMAHGPKIGQYDLGSMYYYSDEKGRLTATWMGMLLALVGPAVIMIWLGRKQHSKQIK